MKLTPNVQQSMPVPVNTVSFRHSYKEGGEVRCVGHENWICRARDFETLKDAGDELRSRMKMLPLQNERVRSKSPRTFDTQSHGRNESSEIPGRPTPMFRIHRVASFSMQRIRPNCFEMKNYYCFNCWTKKSSKMWVQWRLAVSAILRILWQLIWIEFADSWTVKFLKKYIKFNWVKINY